MSPLTTEQKQLLFDTAIGLTDAEERAQAEKLISTHPQASELYSNIRKTLSPLESFEVEECPDYIVELTVDSLSGAAASGRNRLEELLAEEEGRKPTIKIGVLSNLAEMGAIAAVILLMAGVLVPSLGYSRQKYWQRLCQANLGSVFRGVNSYISDHDGAIPAVAGSGDGTWWNVGCPDERSCSSTRPMWLTVRLGYVKATDFVCPGRSEGRALRFDIDDVQKYSDFPARRYITYSPRIHCPKSVKNCMDAEQPLMVDRSPVFESLPEDLSREIALRLNDHLLTVNSRNHRSRGQSILFGDGHVVFARARQIGASQDDIYTSQGMSLGIEVKGCERPSCDADFFFAP